MTIQGYFAVSENEICKNQRSGQNSNKLLNSINSCFYQLDMGYML